MKLIRMLLGIIATLATAVAFLVPDATGFLAPSLARILFFHLPCALVATGMIVAAGVFGVRYLAKRKPIDDFRVAASLELATLMGVLTLVTGSLFSRVQWGAWWQWDPRQTSFLMVQLLLFAALALRASFWHEKQRAAVSAAYAIALVVPALFFILVFPRLEMVQTSHPDLVGARIREARGGPSGGLDANYALATLLALVAVSGVSIWAFGLRVRAWMLEREVENLDDLGKDRGHGAASVGVVRPVALSGSNPAENESTGRDLGAS